jgi:hypothetical protein
VLRENVSVMFGGFMLGIFFSYLHMTTHAKVQSEKPFLIEEKKYICKEVENED